jgi:nucleoside-diphosphate-sugar epimerase
MTPQSDELMRAHRRPTILLTGGSGVVGTALLSRLTSANNGPSIVALVHRRGVDLPGVRSVRGNITAPMLGLSAADYAALTDQVDVVVHSAALVSFRAGDDLDDTNIGGTAQVVEFAERAGAALVHVSSAFLHPPDNGADTRSSARYARTKRAAESLVATAAVPVTVVRPSIVVGHSRLGHITEFQGFYQVVAALRQGLLPVLPFNPDWRLDLIPCDIVADAIAAVVEREWFGRELWITCGRRALTLAQTLDIVVDHAAAGGTAIERPRFVEPDVYHQVIAPVFLPELPRPKRLALSSLADLFLDYLNMSEPFPSSLEELAATGATNLPDPRSSLVACLDYWQDTTAAKAVAA